MYKKLAILALLVSTAVYAEEVATTKLNESVISTENFETNVRETPANITVVTAEEIEKTGAVTLVDALRNVPGLHAREYQDGEVRFDLRGQNAMYANKNIIVTVDGVPVNSVGRTSGSYALSQIPIETIERIEVVPNGGGVLYGSGAVGGMVNIITKSNKAQKSYGNVSLKMGSDNLAHEHITYGTMLTDKLLTEVALTQYNSETFREDEEIQRFNGRFLGKYFMDDGEMEFKYNLSRGTSKISGSTVPYYLPFDTKKGISKKKYEYQDFYGKYRKEISDNLEFLMYANYVHNDSSPYNRKTKQYEKNVIKERKEYLKSQLKYTYLPDSYVIIGGDIMNHSEEDTREKIKDKSSNAEATRKTYGLYLMNKYTYDKFQFTQGIRRDYSKYDFYYKKLTGVIPNEKWYTEDDKSFENTSIELGVNYLYSDTGSTYINYTRTFRAPTATEIGSFEGSPAVQTADTVEIGWKEFIEDTYISGAVYYTKANDYLYSKIPTVPEEWSLSITENLGKVNKYGAELYAEHYFDKLILRGGVTYIHHEIKTDGPTNGKEIPSVPNWKVTLGATYNATEKLSIGADMLYHGSMYVLDYLKYIDESKLPETGDESDLSKYDAKVDSFITVDMFASYKVNESLSLTARIDNIFDKKYGKYVGAWGDYDNDPKYVVQQIYPAPGRTYTLGINYKF